MCAHCHELERRVRELESLQPSGWGVVIRLLFLVFILPATISFMLWTIEQRTQIWAQHPDWTEEAVMVEYHRRIGWDDFSLFTYRPFADRPKTSPAR